MNIDFETVQMLIRDISLREPRLKKAYPIFESRDFVKDRSPEAIKELKKWQRFGRRQAVQSKKSGVGSPSLCTAFSYIVNCLAYMEDPKTASRNYLKYTNKVIESMTMELSDKSRRKVVEKFIDPDHF
jgi:hypothetical protein